MSLPKNYFWNPGTIVSIIILPLPGVSKGLGLYVLSHQAGILNIDYTAIYENNLKQTVIYALKHSNNLCHKFCECSIDHLTF